MQKPFNSLITCQIMNSIKTILLASVLFSTVLDIHAQVVINEFSAANYNVFADNYGEFEDWIELYNIGASSVDLSGYHLSDRVANPTKFVIPSGVQIGANGYLRIWASKRGVYQGGTLHTNFKIVQTRGNEAVVFADPSGVVIDSHTIPVPNQTGHSTGRVTDGASTWGIFPSPSPGNTNANAKDHYAAKPQMSVAPGLYTSAQTVTITTTEPNSTIYYTLNGDAPTPSSIQYSSPVNISVTTILRAITVSASGSVLPSFIESNTYFINDVHTIPVISIAGDQVDDLLTGNSFLDPIGSFELFDDNQVLLDESTGDFNKHGNDSWAYGQRGFDFITRDQYGYNVSSGR